MEWSYRAGTVVAAIFFAATGLSYFLGFLVYRILASRNIIDTPNARSSHTEPTVRGGGIAIIAVIAASAVLIGVLFRDNTLFTLAGASLLLAIISFFDDARPLPPLLRFGCHALCAIAAILAIGESIGYIQFSSELSFRLPLLLSGVLGFLWITGYTNAFNFMDGINGIAAGQAVVTAFASGLLVGVASGDWFQGPVLLCFAIAGAAAGFIPHNFPRARMFMGDVSSAPLGFLLAALVIWLAHRNGPWLLIPLALLHTNFVLDTAVTLFRRVRRGERWYESHREHFYQRLNRAGKSHAFVTGCELVLQLITVALLFWYVHATVPLLLGILGGVLGLWAAFLVYCEAQFRRTAR